MLYRVGRKKVKGQILVESVFFFMLLVTLFFGAMELGNGFLLSYRLSAAAREAVRFASVMPDLEARAGNNSWLGVQTRLGRSLQANNIDPVGVDWEIKWKDSQGNDIGGGNSQGQFTPGSAALGNTIEVELTAPIRLWSGIQFGWLRNLMVRGSAMGEKLV